MDLIACQHNAQLRELRTQLLSCRQEGSAWTVTLEDSVLYPEGGGQPADHGWIEGVPVLDVQRVGGEVQHRVARAVEPGEVLVQVDWTRRFDHMQQHSAQHLLSALAQDRLGLETRSFHLGAELSSVDLYPALGPEEARQLEAWMLEAILADHPIRLRLVEAGELEGLEVRTRGIKEGWEGSIRLVEIEGLDRNTCGGTHVQRLGELGAVSLLSLESYKGGTRVHFVAGGRVLLQLREHHQRSQALSRLLSAPPGEHAGSVSRLQEELRDTQKQLRALQREQQLWLAAELASQASPCAHVLEGADIRQLQALASEVLRRSPEQSLLLTSGGEEGCFLIAGPEEVVPRAGPPIAELLGGRGGGRGGRFQGRASRLSERDQALELLRETLHSSS